MPVNTNTLFAGEQLETNCRLKSTDGRFEFMLDQFGRIRVWDAGNVVWAASSGPAYGGRVTLQTDGHLVLRRADNTAIWTTNVYGFSDARLVLEDNGSLVVYRGDGQVAWSAGAAPPSAGRDDAPQALPIAGKFAFSESRSLIFSLASEIALAYSSILALKPAASSQILGVVL